MKSQDVDPRFLFCLVYHGFRWLSAVSQGISHGFRPPCSARHVGGGSPVKVWWMLQQLQGRGGRCAQRISPICATQALFSSPSCMRRPQLSLNRKIGQKVCCRRVPIIQPPSLHALVQSLLHKYLPLLRDACGEILGQRHATKEPSKRACEIAGLDILANMLGK